MAQPSLLIKHLVNKTKEQFFYHDMRIAQLQQKEYPFSSCKDMLTLLSKIDNKILDELDDLEKELSTSESIDLKHDLDRIKRYGQLVGILHYLITFFEMGGREYIPEGSVVLISSIVKKFEPNASFVLVPIHQYNYVYLDIMKPLRKALSPIPTINDLLGDYPLRYSVFGFPLIQKENSILNSILAHEVGHFVDDAKKTSEKLMSKVKLDPKLVEKIAKTAESAVVGNKKGVKLTYFITPEELKAQITKLAVSQISEWVKELVSDVIAFQLVGPVYLFSLVSLLFTEIDIDEASGDHPPPRIRTTLLLEEFEKQDYCRFIKEIKDEKKREIAGNLISLVQSIKNLLVSVEQIEVEDFTKLVVGSVQQIIPQVREEASKIVSQNRYEPQRFAEEVFKLFDLLDFVIPPVEIETGKPASISSILNAGSLYESLLIENLYKVFEAKTTKEQMMVRNKLHKLILKALELNHIEAQMKKRLKS